MNKIVHFFTFVLCAAGSFVDAAAPATHVYSAQLWMQLHGPKDLEERKAFIAGTLFPDIRYQASISRKETHEKGVTAKKIRQTPNSFLAGKRLHAFVDKKREQFVEKRKVHSKLKNVPKKTRVLFLKLLEDEILWDRIDPIVCEQALGPIYLDETKTGLKKEEIEKWHQTMIKALNERPSLFLEAYAREGRGFLAADAKTVKEWCGMLPQCARDPYFIEYVDSMIEDLQRAYVK